MSEPMSSGVARCVGSVPLDRGPLWRLLYTGDIELYHLDPPLCGYSVVAAATMAWAMRARIIGDPGPSDDPVSTELYGITGGEGLRIEWDRKLYGADGRNPARALAEAGYVVR